MKRRGGPTSTHERRLELMAADRLAICASTTWTNLFHVGLDLDDERSDVLAIARKAFYAAQRRRPLTSRAVIYAEAEAQIRSGR